MEPRIAVTGIGAVHALGVGVEPLLAALRAGRAPEADLLAADFDPEQFRETPKTYMDRCADLALAACYLAGAGLGAGAEHPDTDPSAGRLKRLRAAGPMLNMTARVQQKGLGLARP